jgi:hypothetical protein
VSTKSAAEVTTDAPYAIQDAPGTEDAIQFELIANATDLIDFAYRAGCRVECAAETD